jgi:tetratricopeptide (TPR) repeat protein
LSNVLLSQGTFLEIQCGVVELWSNNKMEGATIELIRNDSIFATSETDSLGKVLIQNIPMQQKFHLKISKEGYVSKLAHFDLTHNGKIFPGTVVQKVEVNLFKPLSTENFSFLDTTALIHFFIADSSYINFTLFDQNWHKTMSYCKKGYTYKQSYKFLALLDSGKNEIDREQYYKAIEQYEAALNIIPDPATKEEYKDLLNLSRLFYTGKLNQTFQELIEKGDFNFENKDYEKALIYYKDAYALKKELYPEIQINNCNRLLEQNK